MSSNDIWSTSDDDLGSDPLYHKILSNEELEVLRQKASAAESPSSGVALPQNPLFVARSPPPSPPLLPFLAHERATDPEDAITHVATTNEDNTMLEDDGYLATGSDYDADHSSSANSEDSGFKRGSGPGNPPFAEMRGTPGSYTTASTLVRDARSVFSFHSSVDLHLFKDSHGRTFNALNKAYHLPGDNEEHERLDIQHKIMTYCVGGLYPAQDIVDNLLRPNQGHTPVVLDVGTGSGTWAIEMANKFPHIEVVGLDLVPPKLFDRTVPENCRFEVDDANLPLVPHYESTFDFVHIRAADAGIHDFESFLYSIAQILKPGGLLMMSSGSPQFYDEHRGPHRIVVEGEEGFCWLQKFYSATYGAYKNSRARNVGLSAKLWHRWAEANPNYEDVVSWQMKVPCGNWLPPGSSPDHQYAAELNRFNVMNSLRSFCPLLISDGYKPEVVEKWRAAATKELMDLKIHSYGNWTWTWCRRSHCAWIPQA